MSASALHKKLEESFEAVEPRTEHKNVALIVPIYNEADTIVAFLEKTTAQTDQFDPDTIQFNYIFVDDGSTDNSLEILRQAQKARSDIKIVRLSRNFGKEAALTAGLDHCMADAAIPIDVDLQDPPEVIEALVLKWLEGHKVVVAKRVDRSSDAFLKRTTSSLFYKVHNRLSADKIPENVGDFRILDRAVIKALKRLPERRRFMKGLFAWVGFDTAEVEYSRAERSGGQTKFNGWKLWNLALEGITSFSSLPLDIWAYIGGFVSVSSFLYGSYILLSAAIFGNDVAGYASLMTAVLFLGGIQLIGIGVLGQYIGRVYAEVKQRPVYIVDRTDEDCE